MQKFPSPAHYQVSKQHPRHWSSLSEDYASGDVLYSVLSDQWRVVDNKVLVERVNFGRDRWTHLYHFVLQKGDCRLRLAVLQNPFVDKLIRDLDLVTQYMDRCSSKPFRATSSEQEIQLQVVGQ